MTPTRSFPSRSFIYTLKYYMNSIFSYRNAGLIALVSICATVLNGQISDPVPESPQNSGIILQLEDFAQIPQSNGSAPRARINHLKPMYDGQGRLAVNDLRGKFWVITNGVVSEYADLDAIFPAFKDSPGLGTGFTSFAFHPEFATNGLFYTAHSENAGTGVASFVNPVVTPIALQGVITEWTASTPSAATFSGIRREILRVDITGTIHGMQEIAFNPNSESGDADYGKLYICIGDGQSTIAGYPLNTHRLDSVLGTILRIDPSGNNSANGAYGVPADNPWADDGDPATFGEIWVYGFRNPHRISWDTGGDGKMLSGDIGERNIEEVNLIESGRDYGWNEREGTFRINPDFANNPGNGDGFTIFPLPENDAEFGYTYPVAQYDHDQGAAIVGGYVYRGTLATALTGKYVFGDVLGGEVYIVEADALAFGSQAEIKELSLSLDGTRTTIKTIGGSNRADLRFGFDEENELYLLEKSRGMIFKVVGATDLSGGSGSSAGDLVNISTRGVVGTDENVLIGGFVIDDAAKQVLVQAIGPELASDNVVGALVDPVLTILDSSGEELETNDNWDDTQGTLISDLWNGSPPFTAGSLSSAIVITLEPGSYTAIISGKDNSTGVALVEVYEID